MSDEPVLDLSWMDGALERAQGTAVLLKQAEEITQKADLTDDDQPPDAIEQMMNDLRERVQQGQEASLGLLQKAGYSETEARDLAAASHDAPSGSTLLQKARSMSAPTKVYRQIGQGRNGVKPE